MKCALLALAFAACAAGVDDASLVEVRRADLAITIDVRGELAAIESHEIRPPQVREVSSWLTVAWLAPDGTDVTAGERIVTFDDGEVTRSLESARAELADATQRLGKRREEVALSRDERALALRESEASVKKQALATDTPIELVASIDARTQRLDLELAQMSLAESRRTRDVLRDSEEADLAWYANARTEALRRIGLLEQSRAALTVLAPRAGTIVYPPAAGKKREVGDSLGPLDTVVQLVQLDRMRANGTVDEMNLGAVALGQPVTLQLDALPDLALTGELTALGRDVVFGEQGKVIEVQIAIAPTHAALRPGMKFRGAIELARARQVLQVPLDAVFVIGGDAVVFRATPRGLERTPVELGRRGGSMIEVVSGLSAGDRVSRMAPQTEGT